MNLANKLTVGRIVLVPIFLIFITANIPYGTFIATAIFIIASITDKLDGYIARSRNQITNFGKFMDPLADKLLVISALVSLVGLKMVPAWVAVIIIARELAVTGLRSIAASEGVVIAASWWGKIKTVMQMIATILMLIKVNIMESVYLTDLISKSSIVNNFFDYVPLWMLYIAAIVTLLSGYDYFKKNRKVISSNK